MHKIPFLTCTALVLALTGCSPDRGTYQTDSSAQNLLEAEGQWQIVEDETETPPDQQHMQAREQVNPLQQVAEADVYTDHYQPADLNEDTRYRVLRLEKRVDGMDRDFKQLLPPLKKLIVPGDELNVAIADIESRQAQESPMPEINERIIVTDYTKQPGSLQNSAPSVTVPVITPASEATPAAPMNGPTITDIRVGEHSGKTRLVLDASGPVTFKYDLDNNEKLLLIELTGAGLSAPAQKNFANSAFLNAYTAQANGNGITLALELKKPAKIMSSATLAPDGANTQYRVFFDIGAL
jgi:hypothetical protein